MRLLGAAILAALFFSSCSAQAEIVLAADGSADFRLSLGLERAFLSYWSDLKELDSTLGPSPFDEAGVSAGARRFPEFQNMRIEVPSPDKLTAASRISSVTALGRKFSGRNGQPLLQAGQNFLQLYLDHAGLSKLLAISDVAESEALSALLPQGNHAMSQQDFEELVAFSLEPYTSEALKLAQNASVTISFTAPSRITGASGAAVTGNRAVWTVPLSRLFRLQDPLVLRAVW